MTIRNGYVHDLLLGRAGLVDIDRYVAAWKMGDFRQSLQDFLGFSDLEYSYYLSGNKGMLEQSLATRIRNS